MPKKPISAPKCGIGSNRAKGVRRRAEKNVIDLGFGLVGDGGDLVRNGEDDVEVLGIKQFGFTILQPLGARQRLALGTAPRTARVVRDALVATAVALLDMAAQCRGATKLDGSHGTALCR